MALFNRSIPVLKEPCGKGYAQLRALSDEEIMQHLSLGHDDALAVLWDRYQRLVLSIATRILRDPSEAQDVCQDVFVKLHRTVAQFDSAKGMARMWVIRFAYQVSLNRRRHLKVRSFATAVAEPERFEPDVVPRDGRLEPAEAARLARQLLGQLNERQRLAIELACYDGLSMEEIATKTGETPGNVRHQYYRGLAKLRVLLAESRPSAAHQREVVDESARQLA